MRYWFSQRMLDYDIDNISAWKIASVGYDMVVLGT